MRHGNGRCRRGGDSRRRRKWRGQENVAWGLTGEHINALRTRSGERLVDAVLESEQNLRLRGKKLTEEVRCDIEGVALTGLLAIPLISSNRKHGVVLLANPQQNFTRMTSEC